ncbi:FtsX-like permease family protein [Tamlana sp. 2201CG12-4]|uniref:ABC transporter permease n=1 Tax=Tamlana sp. 2201CG12-4 TaxID=3112582 RepID=UPI002DB9EDD0|nr:FtsX-like permease family protein [Tamlana sp. 2201CG12-4]MEC3907020.1 FtsX-like permease family protein [Tamlana sp. 2201CG12-4]
MLKHYVKFAFRNFRGNKVIFTGSLATLSLGALCISLLFSYVYNELSMDDFHKREKDIYMIIFKETPKSLWIPSYFEFNAEEYSEIDTKVKLQKYKKGELKFTYKRNIFSPECIIADSLFFEIFDFKLKVGNEKAILSDSDAAIISQQYANLMFGGQNPIGKSIKVSSRYEKTYIIKGIVDIPSNSSITFDFILPSISNSFNRMGVTFLLANKNFDKKIFQKKIKNIGNNVKHHSPQFTKSTTSIKSLKELYFNKGLANKRLSISSHSGNKKNNYVLIIIMIIILCITGLNFSNLQIININTSIKKIGINKIQGAQKKHIIYQKIIEYSLLISFSALIITIAYKLVLPFFNELVKLTLSPPLWKVILINCAILILLAVLALAYPLIIVLRTSLIRSVKGGVLLGNQLIGRKILVITQYTLTCMLIISSIIVTKQLKLMLNKDLGFTSKNVITTKMFYRLGGKREEQQKTYQYVKNELSSHSFIDFFSQGYSPLEVSQHPIKVKENDEEYSTHNILITAPNYNQVLGLKILEGRFFEKERDKQRGKIVVINEVAKRYWNIKDITKTRLLDKYWESKDGYEIIGVIKDFNYEHLSVKPQPLIMLYFEDVDTNFFIQFQEGRVQEGLQFVEALFEKVNPNETFEYSFLSDEIAALYQKEKRLSTIYILFTIIALLISAIGLFTIALYDAQRRVKEIGIRKVNGATINEIMLMLNKDLIKGVLIAFVIACLIAYYAMSKWLENFAYKTSLSWWVFALAGVFTLVIALLTVSWQTYRAATRNPVESLRDE